MYYLHHKLYVIEGFNGMLCVFSFHLLSSCNILIIIVKNPINVICLQECWSKDYDKVTMFNLAGYEMVYKTRSCCAHGGLIIYIHNELECTTITDIDMTSTGWECLCVEPLAY